MTTTYLVLSETENEAVVEFIDSETTLSTKRTINIRGLKTNAERQERYRSHENTFSHRIDLGIIKEIETPKPDEKKSEE